MPKSLIKPYYRVQGFEVFGAPVYVHVSAIVIAGLLGVTSFRSPIFGIIAIVSYLSIILVHELGHAFVANRLGLRVTTIRIGWIHGVCELEDPGDEWRNILVAWGGVTAQVVVGVTVLIIAWAIPGDDLGYFGPVLIFLGYVNLAVAVVNLAPSPELDGATAWRIFPVVFHKNRARRQKKSARDRAEKKWGVHGD